MTPITYAEKGWGLHEAVRAAGLRLEQVNGVWVADDAVAVQALIDGYDPLPAARSAAWARIQDERERRKGAGYMAGGYRFHSDRDSRIQQLGLVLMGSSAPAVPWKTLGSGFVTMTPTLAQQIFQATAAADMALHAAAESKLAAVNALTDFQAIESYDATAGWPEV